LSSTVVVVNESECEQMYGRMDGWKDGVSRKNGSEFRFKSRSLG